jgi:uncharacterized protein (DUF2147 family)
MAPYVPRIAFAIAAVCFSLASLTVQRPASAAVNEVDTPVGFWQTFDDHTHAPRGTIRIFEQDGKLFGRIERMPHGRDGRDLCTACTDDRKDQPLDGLVIIRNMQRSPVDPHEWAGGDVLDPDSGRLYRFTMRLGDDGGKLLARGFIGISLLGRTQTWARLP